MNTKAKHITVGNWQVMHPGKRSTSRTVLVTTCEARLVAECGGPDSEANAALIAEAGTVAHETGMTPRQLAEQWKELLEALQVLVKMVSDGDVTTIELDQARAAIAKTR